jgi:putative DNA primase/helicase
MPEDVEAIKQDKMYCHAFDIINGNDKYIYSLQEDYIYVYEKGYWRQLFEIEFMDRLDTTFPIITKYPLHLKKQIVENFKHKKYLRLEEFNNYPLINFENYMYDPLGDNVLAHNEEYYSTNRIPYKYDKGMGCDLWLKSLSEILEGDTQKIGLLQEFFGYCLVPENDQKKALLLLGETDTGKSTIFFILEDLMGKMNISHIPLQYLPNPQYTPLMINKLINIDADVNKNAGDFEREFKTITSGETVSCNQKHIPTFEFVPKCKIVLAANIFPKITDHSSAFYQRLLVIPCNRRFQQHEINRNLRKELQVELPGIFNWACQGLWRFKKRGRFEQHDFMIEAVQDLEDENNPSNLFFDEHIEIEMGMFIEKGELFKRYQEWCNRTNNYTLSIARFSTAVYKKYQKQTAKNARMDNGGKRIWKNIKYVQFKTNEIKQEINWQDTPAETDKTSSPSTIEAGSKQGDIIWGET